MGGILGGAAVGLILWAIYEVSKKNREGKALGVTKAAKGIGWIFWLLVLGALAFSIFVAVRSA